jgi:hypothetical protein
LTNDSRRLERAEMLTSRLAKLGGVLTSGSRRLERADKPPIGGVPIW